MIQNLNILAGRPPVRTGNDRADLDSCIRYVNQLARALEMVLEQLDTAIEKGEKRNE